MGYYIRVLAEKEDHIPVARLRRRLQQDRLSPVPITVERGDEHEGVKRPKRS